MSLEEDRLALRAGVTIFICLMMFIFGIWSMFHFAHHTPPPPRN